MKNRPTPDRKLVAAALLTIVLSLAPVRAQSPPSWEVVSVKPRLTNVNDQQCADNASPGRIISSCHTLNALIGIAYVMFADGTRMGPSSRQSVPIEGGPSWIHSDRWEIQATAEGQPSREMMFGPMLQKLLEDRFALKLHRETRQVPIYALKVAKGGLK